MVWQESWAHSHAFGFRKKHRATDAAALIALLIELHNIIQECLTGFGLDYVKCFDLIAQKVVLSVAVLQGMHEEPIGHCLACMHSSRDGLKYWTACAPFAATNGILQGCVLSVIFINLFTSIWKKVLDAQKQATQISATVPPPPPGGGGAAEALQFIITALGYADDTYGMASGQHSVQSLLECTHTWLQLTGHDVDTPPPPCQWPVSMAWAMFLFSRGGGGHWQGGPCFFFRTGGPLTRGLVKNPKKIFFFVYAFSSLCIGVNVMGTHVWYLLHLCGGCGAQVSLPILFPIAIAPRVAFAALAACPHPWESGRHNPWLECLAISLWPSQLTANQQACSAVSQAGTVDQPHTTHRNPWLCAPPFSLVVSGVSLL